MTRASQKQFQELNTDVYDEVIRRNNNRNGGVDIPFLPVQSDFHPKRNQARQKLASLPPNRFKDLISDLFCELRRRYPEFKELETLPDIPDMTTNALPRSLHTPSSITQGFGAQHSSSTETIVPSH